MDADQYLQMVDSQLKDAKESMNLAEKSFREAKAKHDGILKFRESYKEWVRGNQKKCEGGI